MDIKIRNVIKNRKLTRFLMCFCTSAAFCLRIANPNEGRAPEILWNFFSSIPYTGDTLFSFCVFLPAVYLFFRYVDAKWEPSRFDAALRVANGFTAFIWLMAAVYRANNNNAEILFSTAGQTLKSVVYFVGMFCGLNYLSRFVFLAFDKYSKGAVKKPEKKPSAWTNALEKRPFLVRFLALLLCWSPHLIINYPANMPWDSWYQTAQRLGFSTWTTHHPPVSTWLTGTVINIGAHINGNFGYFLYVALQAITFAAILSYMFRLLKDLETPEWFRWLTFFFCVLFPYCPYYVTIIVKDNFHSYFFLLLVIELTYMARLGEEFFKSRNHVVLWGIAVFGTFHFRNTAVYLLAILIAALLIRFLKKGGTNARNEKSAASARLRVSVALILPLLLAWGVNLFVIKFYHIAPGSPREMFSMPFQQTARYVKEYGEEVTETEKAAINAVLDYENLASNYNPLLSDPVKITYKNAASKEELFLYFSVWFTQFFKHPIVYFEAAINQNYPLLYPCYTGTLYASLFGFGQDSYSQKLVELFNIHSIESLQAARDSLYNFDLLYFRVPVICFLGRPAFYTLSLLWLCLFSIRKRLYAWLIPFLPVALTALMIILGPNIATNPRYAFPIIYSFPVLLGFYLSLIARQRD